MTTTRSLHGLAHIQYRLKDMLISCFFSQASLKEAEMRLAEIRRAKNDFENKLHKRMTDKRLEMKEPEKCLQYLEDKAKVASL